MYDHVRRRWHLIALLLLVPLIGTLVPELYNRTAPSTGGMPFFCWYQFLWIPISVNCTWIVYRVTTRRPR